MVLNGNIAENFLMEGKSNMEMPSFTEWKPWGNREDFEFIKEKPGIYLLSKFKSPNQATNPVPSNENVVYIGETCDQTLWKRLNDFQNSATTGNPAHAGGETYFSEFGGNISDLFVSIRPYGERKNPVDAAYIRCVERYAIWVYAQTYGMLPRCNKK